MLSVSAYILRGGEDKRMIAENYVNQFLSKYEKNKKIWNYEDGCVLLGARQLYEATGKESYVAFIKDYVNRYVAEDGTITIYDQSQHNIDSINASKIFYFLYENTGEELYRKAIEFTMEQLRSHPRCDCGSFFHKEIYPWQIWLDGLYMAQPFYMEYETKFNGREHYQDILLQFENARKYLYCEEKGLYFHAYDEKKQQFWCSRKTGCSPNFWLRSMGWYLMSLIDTMDVMDQEIFELYKRLEELFREGVKGILAYQDPESKLFYQVIDRNDVKENYLETSGSAMVAYAILKGCRLRALSREKYAEIGFEILQSLMDRQLKEENGELHLHGICSVAGLGPETSLRRDGSVEYYLSEKVVADDPKGVGPFMMAYAQKIMLEKVL